MAIDERLEAVARSLDLLTQIRLDNDREFRDRSQQLTHAQEKNAREIEALKTALQLDAEKIRALARIAELQHQRLNRLKEQ